MYRYLKGEDEDGIGGPLFTEIPSGHVQEVIPGTTWAEVQNLLSQLSS